jgi:hypothetical protein
MVEHVDVLVVDPELLQDLGNLVREPTLGGVLCALHEKNHVVAGDQRTNPVVIGLLAHSMAIAIDLLNFVDLEHASLALFARAYFGLAGSGAR